jgi:hypothetical protein
MSNPTHDQLQQRMHECSLLSTSLQQRYAGELNIFNAAAALQNGKEMDELRARIHNTVDQMLDNNVTLFMLTGMMMQYRGM